MNSTQAVKFLTPEADDSHVPVCATALLSTAINNSYRCVANSNASECVRKEAKKCPAAIALIPTMYYKQYFQHLMGRLSLFSIMPYYS